MRSIKRFFVNSLFNISSLTKLNSLKSRYLELAMHGSDSLISTKPYFDSEVIVSLTTYSKRIHDVHLVIESLGFQTNKANKIVLWLDEVEFDRFSLPNILEKQVERGLQIKYYKNIRSYKKIIPALHCFPDSKLITVDDDILYPHDFIEQMIKGHLADPKAIIAQRINAPVLLNKDKISPYKKWEFELSTTPKNKGVFFTSGAGTLFPPKCLHQDVTDEDTFNALCPFADDIWLNIMAFKNGTKILKVKDDRSYSLRFTVIDESQDIALENLNIGLNKNDEQLSDLLDHFDLRKDYVKYING